MPNTERTPLLSAACHNGTAEPQAYSLMTRLLPNLSLQEPQEKYYVRKWAFRSQSLGRSRKIG